MTDKELIVILCHDIVGLRDQNRSLQTRVATLERMVEDVACGTQLECSICGKNKPCMCDKK